MVRLCSFAELKHLIAPAAGLGVTIEDDPETTWFGVHEGGRIVAVGGLKDLGDGVFRLRGAFTLSEYRGRGLGERISSTRVLYAASQGAIELETHSLHPSFYLARGWIDTGSRRPSGSWVLRRPLRAVALQAETSEDVGAHHG